MLDIFRYEGPFIGERVVKNAAAVLVTATTIFTIGGGPIQIEALVAVCVTANGATASTLQWSHDPTDGAAATFSGASASLANAAAGAILALDGTALSTAPNLAANGPVLAAVRPIILVPGIITTTIATGSSTGTWQHFMRYRPLGPGVWVS